MPRFQFNATTVEVGRGHTVLTMQGIPLCMALLPAHRSGTGETAFVIPIQDAETREIVGVVPVAPLVAPWPLEFN